MNVKPHKRTVDVPLTEEERRLRAGQASRAWPALAKQEAKIEAKKAEHKDEIKKLGEEKTTIITTARTAALAAESGKEPREVLVEDKVVGRHVITVLAGTIEEVDSREASDDELEEWDDIQSPKSKEPARVPGSKATAPEPPAPGTGHDPTDIAGALDRELPRICKSAHNETFVLKALERGVKASTPKDRKDAVERAIAAGHLGEVNGKLLWAPNEPRDESPVVPDDYDPHAPPVH